MVVHRPVVLVDDFTQAIGVCHMVEDTPQLQRLSTDGLVQLIGKAAREPQSGYSADLNAAFHLVEPAP